MFCWTAKVGIIAAQRCSVGHRVHNDPFCEGVRDRFLRPLCRSSGSNRAKNNEVALTSEDGWFGHYQNPETRHIRPKFGHYYGDPGT
jgi:hypothetical protein